MTYSSVNPNLILAVDWTKIVHNMSTIQLKVTLSKQLHSILQKRAQTIGLTMSSYVKNLIIDDIKETTFEEKLVSDQVEMAYEDAKNNKKQAIKIHKLQKTLDNL
ncbi:MAG: hypothetical protein GX559_01520 [Candidatus Pacebacteria bacterium]|mgnify:CR=1 FL=1|nr:hypothetical protein [Candidatus Paceibacterota bacterium]